MRLFRSLALIPLFILVLTVGMFATVAAQCDGTPNDDTIVCNDDVGDILGNDGNDTIIVNDDVYGFVEGENGNDTIIINVNGDVEYDVEGNDGNDTIIIYGDVYDDLEGGNGDDMITVAEIGYIDDDVEGNDGNDVIIIGGYVDDDVEGNDGNDTIRILRGGYVDEDVEGGDGDDMIVIDGDVWYVDGGEGSDIIGINVNGDSYFTFLDAGEDPEDYHDTLILRAQECESFARVVRDLAPESGELTYNGNLFGWADFDELGVILDAICASHSDGRLNAYDPFAAFAVYCAAQGVTVLETDGTQAFSASRAEIDAALAAGTQTVIASGLGNMLYASDGQLVVQGPSIGGDKTYSFDFSADCVANGGGSEF